MGGRCGSGRCRVRPREPAGVVVPAPAPVFGTPVGRGVQRRRGGRAGRVGLHAIVSTSSRRGPGRRSAVTPRHSGGGTAMREAGPRPGRPRHREPMKIVLRSPSPYGPYEPLLRPRAVERTGRQRGEPGGDRAAVRPAPPRAGRLLTPAACTRRSRPPPAPAGPSDFARTRRAPPAVRPPHAARARRAALRHLCLPPAVRARSAVARCPRLPGCPPPRRSRAGPRSAVRAVARRLRVGPPPAELPLVHGYPLGRRPRAPDCLMPGRRTPSVPPGPPPTPTEPPPVPSGPRTYPPATPPTAVRTGGHRGCRGWGCGGRSS